MTTTTLFDRADEAREAAREIEIAPDCRVCRIGLLGLGNVGSAFARAAREWAPLLAAHGIAPVVESALVRSPDRARAAAAFVGDVAGDADAIFARPIDVLVEALGGIEPARTLVARALEFGIPVVTANKSLIAAHGEELSQIARRRRTTIRYEASCIAGVPFLGTFERRPLAARASSVTAILNGTSNAILTAMSEGASFDAALADAQRRGLAEPDPSMDVSGADAAEKLAILVRLFGRLAVTPGALPAVSIEGVTRADADAARAFDGAVRPVARASWRDGAVEAFVGPAFVAAAHPLSRARGVTNGIVIAGAGGVQCFTGPGAGPDVTAATLLDDVVEIVESRRARVSSTPIEHARSITHPRIPWFLRLTATARDADVADLLGSYGIWTARLARRGECIYALTCAASNAHVTAATAAFDAATCGGSAAFPALVEDDAC